MRVTSIAEFARANRQPRVEPLAPMALLAFALAWSRAVHPAGPRAPVKQPRKRPTPGEKRP